MSDQYTILIEMLEHVALALGRELRDRVAFVGGCATALMITDEVTKEEVRFTDDVDLVIQLTGKAEWAALVEQLRPLGFTLNPQDEVICRLRLGDLKVDFMPSDAEVLGFSNTWYEEGLAHASIHVLPSGVTIRVFSSPYFLATKFEAHGHRGNNDILYSKDIEDIANVINGRESLPAEVAAAAERVKKYIKDSVAALMEHRDFPYLLQDVTHDDRERSDILEERFNELKDLP